MAITLDGTNGITAPDVEVLDTDGATLLLNRNDSDVAAGDLLGQVAFYDADGGGTGPGIAASVASYAESAFGASSLRFSTSQSSGGNRSALTERMRITNGGDVLVKTADARIGSDVGSVEYGTSTANSVRFYSSDTERMRIDSSGNLLVGTTSASNTVEGLKASKDGTIIVHTNASAFGQPLLLNRENTNGDALTFRRANSTVGSISVTGSATSYNTSSDYRLKHDIQPMTGALAKVAQLKPVTYKWNADGSQSQGFIAHELQAVVPECVTGEKDAVNGDGSIKSQGVDTSFLVATLTAAIQELSAKNDALEARIAALEGSQT